MTLHTFSTMDLHVLVGFYQDLYKREAEPFWDGRGL